MTKILLPFWRVFPTWLQEVASRFFRPFSKYLRLRYIFSDKTSPHVTPAYQQVHPGAWNAGVWNTANILKTPLSTIILKKKEYHLKEMER
jgi:hypothetical protein